MSRRFNQENLENGNKMLAWMGEIFTLTLIIQVRPNKRNFI